MQPSRVISPGKQRVAIFLDSFDVLLEVALNFLTVLEYYTITSRLNSDDVDASCSLMPVSQSIMAPALTAMHS